MNRKHTTIVIFFVAILFITNCGLVCAQQHDEEDLTHAKLEDAGKTQMLVQNAKARKVQLGKKADAESIKNWKRNRLQLAWQRKYPHRRKLDDECIESILSGDSSCPDGDENQWKLEVKILNSEPSLGLSSVGMLLKGPPGGKIIPWCTISLTRPDTVLTARHCISSKHPDDVFVVYFPYEGIREIDPQDFRFFCSEPGEPTGCSTQIDDLALLTFSPSYSILQIEELGTASNSSNSQGRIVGFGFDDIELADHGIKREASITLEQCRHSCLDNAVSNTLSDEGRALCFKYKESNDTDVGIAAFDSGGPMYRGGDEIDEMIGVARGIALDCSEFDVEAKYVDITNGFYNEWLLENAFSGNINPPNEIANGEKQNTQGKQERDPNLIDQPFKYLDKSGSDSYPLKFENGYEKVIFTLNHEVGSDALPNDLEIQFPTLSADCLRYTGAEACTVHDPSPGDFVVNISKVKRCKTDDEDCIEPFRNPGYQFTATAFFVSEATDKATETVKD